MEKQSYLSKSRYLLLFLFALIVGTGSAWADTLTETFDDVTVTSRYLLSNGWLMKHNNGSYQGFGGSYDYQIKSGNYDGETGSSLFCDYSDNNEYVVIPTKLCGTFSYYVKRSGSSNGTVTFFEATREGDVFTVTNKQLATTSTSSSWSSKSFDLGSNGKYVAIRLIKSRIDQISSTIYEEASGPALTVKDGSTTISSPYAYNFGLATAGTEKVFTLSNPGTEATPIAIDVTGANGFTAAVEGNATSIPAGGQKTLTITMPDATASGSIVVTPTGAGLSAFTFNVSGTVRDPNKVYETLSSKPDGWNTTGTWSYNSSGATTTAWYLSSDARIYTPKLIVAEGEKFIFEVKGNYDGYHAVQLEYSTDATTWTASETSVTVTSDWQTVEISDIPAGNYYIALHTAYSTVRNFYGGELPKVAKMVVTQPATLDFGLYDKDATPAPTKTFTIANTGTATLNGISVTSGNAAFTITNAPTSLAAGASQTVTITMATGTTGALSSLITVSATDMQDVKFTVSGAVMPVGAMTVDFESGLPANWTNSGMTVSAGTISSTNSSNYVTTPKLIFSDGDFIVVKAKRNDSGESDYIKIQGSSDNGSTYSAYEKTISGSQGLSYPDYSSLVISDIPTTINKLKIIAWYGTIDEITGLTYAPSLSVTTGDPAAAVNTPANYDFGECADNASVTYNFANAGAGTINITNVAITGDGAAAYSTNWTESVAAPFDLVITRTYDSSRAGAGAQEAAVTVTTSEGAFVINVTGTDQAANAPTLAVDNTLNFGKLTANSTETVTVTNSGTGSMAVNIASDNALFTISPASLTEIGAGASKTFDVTFHYDDVAGSYGNKSANITVTPTYDAEAAIVIAATANAKDPDIWDTDFSGNALPDGWTLSTSGAFTFANGIASGHYSTNGTLTTPLLTVEATTDELTFKYKRSNAAITIKKQKDGGDWESLVRLPSSGYQTDNDWQTYTITGLEAGNYKFQFTNDDYDLDDFEGFKFCLNDPTLAVYSDAEATQAVATATTKDFGWAQSSQSATYYIKNGGTGTLTISDIDVPAGFTAATAGNATTVAAGADPLALTVTMSAGEIGEKSGTVTLTTDGGNFTIPVKGFIYGSKNLVDFTNASQYTGWTGVNVTDNVAALSSTAIQTTKFAADAAEKLYVEIKGSSSYGSKSFSYSYSRDNGANWSAATALVESTYGNVADQVFTISDIANPDNESTVLIRFTGSNLGINRIYGFTPVATPVMALDKTDDYNFGMQTAAAEYVITVTNNGTGDLEHLEATLTTGTDYTVSVAATTVAPGENTTITITQKASTAYASHSDVLTISADDVNNVVINLSGKTRNAAKYFADFEAAGMPVGWTATGWSRTGNASNYYAQAGYSGTNTLQTPALTIAAGEEIKYDAWVGYTGGTFKVRYTTNGGISWTEADVEATTTQTTKTLSLGNEAAVTAYIQFVGDYYARIDNFYGGTVAANAPLIKVTKSAAVVENGTTEEFGDILAEATATYTVTNAGTGTLTITSPVATTGVATAAIDETSLATGESATLTITMPIEAPYGEKSGAVTVETNLGNFVINYTATTMNPNTLNVDFSDNTLPVGWYKESGWNNYSQEIYRSDRNSDQYFVTQKLNVAGTSDVLKFDAKKYGSYYASSTVLKVSYSTDRVNWTEIDSYASEMTTSYKTFEISGLAAGEYYLKFTGRYASIDNIIGWTKVAGIEHDLYVTATSFPATTTKGNSATISATVTSLIAAETGVYAKLFINGSDEAEATAGPKDISLNGTQTFSFTYAIPENKTAQIKVYYSDHTEAFATAENDMKVNYTFDEEVDPSTITAGTFDVTLNRSFVEGWNTICLPFAVTDIEGVFGDGVKIYGFDSKNGDNLRFTSVDETEAGTPYLIKMPAAKSDAIVMNNVSVSDAAAGTVEQSSIILHGSYAPMAAGTLTGCYGVNSKNQIAPANEYTIMKGFRAYFSGSVAGARISVFDETTGITTVYGADKLFGNDNRIYNLKGQHVENAKKGIYIVNGKKVVIK